MPTPRIVLLIHGVTSTGEWHPTVQSVLNKLFISRPIKYRYYHGWFGALKVYISPTALALALAVVFLFIPLLGPQLAATPHLEMPSSAAWWLPWLRVGLLTVLMLVLALNAIMAERDWAKAEAEWTSGKGGKALWLPPCCFAVLGLATGVLGSHALAFGLFGTIAAISLFLDLREYDAKDKQLDQETLWIIPLLLQGISSFGAWCLAETATWRMGAWLVVGLITLGIAEAIWLRAKLAFELVHAELAKAQKTGLPVNVVAHSLGTYLTGHVLNEVDWIRLHCIILSGCVLERNFPWHRSIGTGSRGACSEVWNYAAGCDPVPLITGFLRMLWVMLTCPARLWGIRWLKNLLARMLGWRALGSAGNFGFQLKKGFIHGHDAGASCAACKAATVQAPIHNVVSLYSWHSSLNQAIDFQRFHWLPALMRIAQDEYRKWLQICLSGYQSARPKSGDKSGPPGDPLAFAAAEQCLLSLPWFWPDYTCGAPLPARAEPLRWYVDRIATVSHPGVDSPQIDDAMKRLPRMCFEKVWQGWEAANTAVNGGSDHILYLDPREALAAAFDDALRVSI